MLAYDPYDLRRTTEDFVEFTRDPNVLLKGADAAILLGVRHDTLIEWRLRNVGPPMVELPGIGRVLTDNTVGNPVVRYRYGDLVAFIWHMRRLMAMPPDAPHQAPAPRDGAVLLPKKPPQYYSGADDPLWTEREEQFHRRRQVYPGIVRQSPPKGQDAAGPRRRTHLSKAEFRRIAADAIADAGGGLSTIQITRHLLATTNWTPRRGGLCHPPSSLVSHRLRLSSDWFIAPVDRDDIWTLTDAAIAAFPQEKITANVKSDSSAPP
jgi:hypothetical protein